MKMGIRVLEKLAMCMKLMLILDILLECMLLMFIHDVGVD